ncbi:MAG TPA: hypothetical protein PLA85_04375 [Micropepsaceae bacterium]|nr:hypothetical protein [Micropepsaceae bacterium]HRK70797.1 hypothetical protein [Micropepsaceae bacterium]
MFCLSIHLTSGTLIPVSGIAMAGDGLAFVSLLLVAVTMLLSGDR